MKKNAPTSARLTTATVAKAQLRVEVADIQVIFPKIRSVAYTADTAIIGTILVTKLIDTLTRHPLYGCQMLDSLRRFSMTFTLLGLLVIGLTIASCSNDANTSQVTATSTGVTADTAGKPQSSVVLNKQAQTVLDQLLQYPSGSQAQVSSAILTIAPGVSTGLHKHDAPMYAYILEGTLTVTYEGGIVKEFSAGSAILEAVGTPHNGENKTDKPVKILVVNMGAEGVANSVTL